MNYRTFVLLVAGGIAAFALCILLGHIWGFFGRGANYYPMLVVSFLLLFVAAALAIYQELFSGKINIWSLSLCVLTGAFGIMTLYAWIMAKEFIQFQTEMQFKYLAQRNTNQIIRRFASYEQVLLGGVGFINGSNFVDSDEWKRYVEALNLVNYLPGTNGIGLMDIVDKEDVPAYEEEMQRYYPGFRVHPETGLSEKYVVKYLEPILLRDDELGLDLAFEFERRRAAEMARESGAITLTRKVSLMEGEQALPGFIMFAPIYPGNRKATGEAFRGWVFSSFSVRNFLRYTRDVTDGQLSLEIFDGNGRSQESRFYGDEELYGVSKRHSHLEVYTLVPLANRVWTVRWTPTKLFRPQVNLALPTIILLMGFVVTCIFSGLFMLLSKIYNRSARQRKQAEEQFRSAMEYSSIGMALVAPDGRWLQVNRAVCAITGYDSEELMDIDFQKITHPDDLEADLHLVHQVLDQEIESYQMEKRYIRKDGSIVWVLLSVSLVWDDHGNPLHFISQIQDISKRKQVEKEREELIQELKRSNGDLERFAEVASKDLRESLCSISTTSADLMETAVDRNFEKLQVIHSNGRKMEKFLDNLLDYSRIGQETDGRFRECIRGDLLVEEIVAVLSPSKEMRIVVDESLGTVEIFRMPIQQVLSSLIENAIEHHDQREGTVVISAEEQGEKYAFCVQDDGPGFNSELLGEIKHTSGIGMGLSVATKILSCYGGAIQVQSQGKRGCSVIFTWPKSQLSTKFLAS